MPAAQLAVLDLTCELPLQVATPAYLALPTWDTHCALAEGIGEEDRVPGPTPAFRGNQWGT